jgi:hypothetical protein
VIKQLFVLPDQEIKQHSVKGVKIAQRSNHHAVSGLTEIIEKYPFSRLIQQPFLAPTQPAATADIVFLMRQQKNLINSPLNHFLNKRKSPSLN